MLAPQRSKWRRHIYIYIYIYFIYLLGTCGSLVVKALDLTTRLPRVVVKALGYKPEGRGFVT
jgi:hypothetical protein